MMGLKDNLVNNNDDKDVNKTYALEKVVKQ